MWVLVWALLSLCTLVFSDSIVSVLGIVVQTGTGTATTYTPVLYRGTFITLQIPVSGSGALSLLSAFGGPMSGSYYVMDQQSHLYQVNKATGGIGEITTYPGVYSPNCMGFDRARGVLVVTANTGVVVLNPYNSTPLASWPFSSYNVTCCQVNSAMQELWLVSGDNPNTINIVNYGNGKVRQLKLPVAPLSLDFTTEGVFYLSNSGHWKQWGGVSVLTLANVSTGETILDYNYSFPEGGSVPTDRTATAVTGLDSSDPSHVLFSSIMWDNENGFVCTAAVEYCQGQFTSRGGTFAAFGGLRPGEFVALATEASV
jgi:hypothetical protein